MTVPLGVIAAWSGLLADIPANWNLCDGTGGTPNLVARFLRGAPAATEPGTIGGSDTHSHTVSEEGSHSHTTDSDSHSHTVNNAGSHSHGSTSDIDDATPVGSVFSTESAGSHTHTTSSEGHFHFGEGFQGDHTHVVNASDGRPPFYEVAFIQAGAGALVVPGLIIIWTGLLADIPAGWSLCDGGDTRPDLRTKFVRGVNTGGTDPGATGGSTTHTHTEKNGSSHTHTLEAAGDHSHSFSADSWPHNHDTNMTPDGDSYPDPQPLDATHKHHDTDTIGEHTHDVGISDAFVAGHTVNATSSLPAYFEVAYIINVSGELVPTGGVLAWTGLLANIPAGYTLCDGADTRPDLRAKFLRGSATGVNPGGGGGSDTHTHTDDPRGDHSDHSVSSEGAHQHTPTDTIGSHAHGGSYVYRLAGSASRGSNDVAGGHSHTFDNEGGHSHSLTTDGEHDHNPWSTDDGRPAFYEVAFIWKKFDLTTIDLGLTESSAAKEVLSLIYKAWTDCGDLMACMAIIQRATPTWSEAAGCPIGNTPDGQLGEWKVENWKCLAKDAETGFAQYQFDSNENMNSYHTIEYELYTVADYGQEKGDIKIRLYTDADNYFWRAVTPTSAETWGHVSHDVGAGSGGWTEAGSPDWSAISMVGFEPAANCAALRFDALHLTGALGKQLYSTVSDPAVIEAYWLEGKTITSDNIFDAERAEALAQAILDRYKAPVNRSTYVCSGTLNVNPGQAVDVSIPTLDITLNQRKVISVKWIFDGRSERTEIQLEEDPLPAQLALRDIAGIVSQFIQDKISEV